MGVFVFDRAAAGRVRAGARGLLAVLRFDDAADRAVHRAARHRGRVGGHPDWKISRPAEFSGDAGVDRGGRAGARRVLVEGHAGHEQSAGPAHAGGAGSVAGQDAFYDVSVPAELLAFVGSAAIGGRHRARRRFFCAGAVEQHAVLWRHRLHQVWRAVLRHGVGGAKPRGQRFQTGFPSPASQFAVRRPSG